VSVDVNFRTDRDSGARKERVSTALVESTVNRLINWRMCKKKQMRWSKPGAYCLLQLKTAAINRSTASVCRGSAFCQGRLTIAHVPNFFAVS